MTPAINISHAVTLPEFAPGPVVFAGPGDVTIAHDTNSRVLGKTFQEGAEPKGFMGGKTFMFTGGDMSNPEIGLETLKAITASGGAIVNGAPVERALGHPTARLAAATHGDNRTIAVVPRSWVGIDIEGMPCPCDPNDREGVEAYLRKELMGSVLRDTTMIIGYSSSMGYKMLDDAFEMKVRVFVWLDKPMMPKHIKYWLRSSGLMQCYFDPLLYNDAQLNYVANPVFVPPLVDPITVDRYWLVRGERDTLSTPPPGWKPPTDTDYTKGANKIVLSPERRAQIQTKPPEIVIRSAKPGELHALTLAVLAEYAKSGASYTELQNLRPAWRETNSKKGNIDYEFTEMVHWAFNAAYPAKVATPKKIPSVTIKEATAATIEALQRREGGVALIRTDLGVGKTEQAIRNVNSHTHSIVWCVPHHVLAKEAQGRLEAAGHDACVWKGAGQPDPNDDERRMCWRYEDLETMQRMGGGLSDLCGGSEHGYCVYHPMGSHETVCGYHCQRADAPVMIFAGTPMTSQFPQRIRRNMKDRGCPVHVVVDEPDPIAMLEPVAVPLFFPEIHNPKLGGKAEAEEAWENMVAIIHRFLAFTGTTLDHDEVEDILHQPRLFNTASLSRYRHLLAAQRVKVHGRKRQTIKYDPDVARHNKALIAWDKTIAALVDVYQHKSAAHFWRDKNGQWHTYYCPRITRPFRIGAATDDYPETTKVDLLDATADPQLLSTWWHNLKLIDTGMVVDGEGVTRTQVWDWSGSYYHLTKEEGGEPATHTLPYHRDIIHLVWHKWREHGGSVGVILYKGLRDIIEQDFPPGVAVAHPGALRGVDEMSDVRCLLVVGRQLPPSTECQRIAGALLPRVSEGAEEYVKGDSAYLMRKPLEGRYAWKMVSTDKNIEQVRAAICDAELDQAEGRARGVRRTADNPVEIIRMTNHPGPRPVDNLVTYSALMSQVTPVSVAVAHGVTPQQLQKKYGRWDLLQKYWNPDAKQSASEWYRGKDIEEELREVAHQAGEPEDITVSVTALDRTGWTLEANELWDWLCKTGRDSFTSKEINRGPRSLRNAAARKVALMQLRLAGVITTFSRRWTLTDAGKTLRK